MWLKLNYKCISEKYFTKIFIFKGKFSELNLLELFSYNAFFLAFKAVALIPTYFVRAIIIHPSPPKYLCNHKNMYLRGKWEVDRK